mmetsp:Transcript_16825/g.67893  ORF Transcript_16825/g.67893 Transcript_16825/m.67893 type:complete len:672 (-) Transcript_16825:451-2466(-)
MDAAKLADKAEERKDETVDVEEVEVVAEYRVTTSLGKPERQTTTRWSEAEGRQTTYADGRRTSVTVAAQKAPLFQNRPWRPIITYEQLFWLIFVPLTAWWILDRFFGNVWPRDSFDFRNFSIRGSRSFSSDRRSKSGWGPKLKDGPWSVKIYDILARVSGRFTMFGLNAMMFVYMHTLHHYMMESRWLSELIDFTDVTARHRIHAWMGYAMAVATLSHIWTILLPCVTHGYNAKVMTGHFDLPISERTPKGFKDADSKKKLMMLQVDDVWRLALMSTMFLIVLPITLRLFKTRFRTALKIHQFAFIMYFIDIWRRHSHPHSWILNSPVFVLWLADLAIGRSWRRLDTSVDRVWISNDYQVLFWQHEGVLPPAQVGPLYYLKRKTQALYDRAHPFSAFLNHVGLPVPPDAIGQRDWSGHAVAVRGPVLVSRLDDKTLEQGDTGRIWHAGTVMRVYTRKNSSTRRIAEAEEAPELIIWGPFPENNVIRYALPRCDAPLLLVAGGSGVSFILDFFSHLHDRAHPVTLAFTTNDVGLFQFFCWTLLSMARRIYGEALAEGSKFNVLVIAALTDKSVKKIDGSTNLLGFGRIQLGRLNFVDLASQVAGGAVFAVAGDGLQKAARRGAKKNKCAFYAGPVYDNIPKTPTKTTLIPSADKAEEGVAVEKKVPAAETSE